jgi:hypothetical protein
MFIQGSVFVKVSLGSQHPCNLKQLWSQDGFFVCELEHY